LFESERMAEETIISHTESNLNCRFYEQKYPDVDELVMVVVKGITDMGAYVSLLEYNNIEGMILLSELSRRRIRSMTKVTRIGKQEAVVVLRVDKDKGYIDLSKKRVSPEEYAKCEERYNKAKLVHSVLRHVSEVKHKKLEELYQEIGWPLYKRFGHAYDAFKLSITETDRAKVFDNMPIPADLLEELMKNIVRRLTPHPIKVRADVDVTCFHYDGIDAIKAALRAGIDQHSTTNSPISIKLVAPPLYVITATYVDKDLGVSTVQKVLDSIKVELAKRKGELVVKMAPRAVTDREDHELSSLMEQLENANREVDGDADSDGGEES